MKRKEVYKLIDGERAYQDSRWARPDTDKETTVASWIIYIEKKLDEAKDKIYWLDNNAALERIRQIAALAVVCMENNDTPPR
jgi:hypothetical protein